MPTIPSLIDIFIAFVMVMAFWLVVITLALIVVHFQSPEQCSRPAALLALPSVREEEFMAYPYDGYGYEDEESFDDLDEADDYSTGGLEDWQ